MPKPTFSFTIPSIQDSTPLNCRVFLPKSFSVSTIPSGSQSSIGSSSSSQSSQSEPSHASTKISQEASNQPKTRLKAAIIAHPYASLGGSYDDPVVGFVAKELLSHGFVVGTFNFRCVTLVLAFPQAPITLLVYHTIQFVRPFNIKRYFGSSG